VKSVSILASVAAILAQSAIAQPIPPAPNNGVCLWARDIDHTHTVDPQHILFYLKNGKVWENTLKGPCPALEFHGFNTNSHDDRLCSNEEAITVIETGEACALGNFTPYAPAPADH